MDFLGRNSMNNPTSLTRDTHQVMRHLMFVFTIMLTVFLMVSPNGYTQSSAKETGTISGKLVDAKTGDVIIGATVMVEGTQLGAQTDLDGRYSIRRVPAGAVNLVVRAIGFTAVTITDVQVTAGEVTRINPTLSSETIELGEKIEVTAKAVQNTGAALLKQRQAAASVSDAISSEEISKSGAGDAADAMSRVTGASITDGKFVYVRGLGDRYSNTNINGSPIPSPDPDRQAVPLDMFPTGLLDNIVVQKTFTPDKPGNFTGGSVDLTTRDFPEYRQLSFSTSVSYNSETTGKSILMADEGSKDWLGYDDGRRDIPQYVEDNYRIGVDVPTDQVFINGSATPDTLALVEYIDRTSNSFNPVMAPQRKTAPWSQKYGFSYGDQFRLFDRPLGVIATLSYNNKYSARTVTDGNYEMGSPESPRLGENSLLTGPQGAHEVLWGGLANLKYTIHNNHKLGAKYIHNQSGINEALYRAGENYNVNNDTANFDYRRRELTYVERSLSSVQLDGEHFGFFGSGLRLNWQASYSKTNQDEPDYRNFNDQIGIELVEDPISGDLVPGDTIVFIDKGAMLEPNRRWSTLDEENRTFDADLLIPVFERTDLKTGFSYLKKDRDRTDREFRYGNTANYQEYGNIDEYIRDMGIERVDTLQTDPVTGEPTRMRWFFSNVLSEFIRPSNNYTGEQEVTGAYLMTETSIPFISRLKLIGGVRFEKTQMQTVNGASAYSDILETGTAGEIDVEDWLPSINLVYSLTDRMNLRGAFGKTLARPNLLEMSAAVFPDPEGGEGFVIGNPDLNRTKVDNFDLRWEWFLRPGEILAVSGFFKDFTDPIEQVYVDNDANNSVTWANVGDATVYGLEVEFRRRLDHVSPKLRYFTLGGNFTFIEASVKLNENELEFLRQVDPNISDERDMQGQSPFIINADIGYDNPLSGTSITLLYNVYGERLAVNAPRYTPDVYEQERHSLDLITSQRVFEGVSLKFSAKNILNDPYEFTHELNGVEYYDKKYETGRTFSFGVSYKL
ncbi:TonB-dependent receptor plug domain-containing protein [candidate division GN15 bacterium]|nr:TonB-dependent receptor plug domain-containing protein [candidate division GN15 bacterium]